MFLETYDKAAKILKNHKGRHIGNRVPYQDIMSLWKRDKRFLDKDGKPRVLSMNGKDGFAALVREGRGAHDIEPNEVLSVLLHYGNVRRVGKDKYSPATSFFNVFGSKDIAFEPHASFLSDASDTMSRMLFGRNKSKGVTPFWLRVENFDLSAAAVKSFRNYALPRSLAFLEEIDDWLGAHAQKTRSRAKLRKRRVGLGIFFVHSNRTGPL
jgi:hypothetical protein